MDERKSDTPVAENNGEEIKSAEANAGGVEEPAQAKEEDEAEVATRTISQLMQKSNTGGVGLQCKDQMFCQKGFPVEQVNKFYLIRRRTEEIY